MVVAVPIDMTIMKALLPRVMAIWLALMAILAVAPTHPIMMPVPTNADDSRNICSEIGSPMCTSRPIVRRERTRSENPSR